MAATASPLPAMSPADDALDEDLSSMSTPLSLSDVDVDAKGSNADDADTMQVGEDTGHEEEEEEDDDDESASNSNLSEANDTEAETERLYDTPENHRQKDVLVDQYNNGRVFEHTPSKLRAAAHATDDAELADDDAHSDDDDASLASSHAEEDESPTKKPKTAEQSHFEDEQAAEARKRKRSPLDQSDPEQPLRKRTGSIGVLETEMRDADDHTADDDTGLSTNPHSGEHSIAGDVAVGEPDKDVPTPEDDAGGIPAAAKKSTRNGSKRREKLADSTEKDDIDAEGPEEAADAVADEDAEPVVEDDAIDADHEDDIDGAAKNDEELEKKRLAFMDWSDLKERFNLFRERLYKDRLDKLEQEEQSLLADEPTHPEFLNMKQCLDARLETRIRQIEKEYQLEVQAVERVSVAQRAQVFGQFYQSVRESREAIVDSLNEEWYEIQNRRRSAHSVQEFGLLYHANAQQLARNAMAYNNEVSRLAGIAKYKGFPAGPPLRAASNQEVDDDLEAMKRGRRPRQYSVMQPLEEHALLGPAGEQFIQNTPWANPHHAAHKRTPTTPVQPDARATVPVVGTKPAPSSHTKRTGSLSGAGRAPKGGSLATAKSETAIATNG